MSASIAAAFRAGEALVQRTDVDSWAIPLGLQRAKRARPLSRVDIAWHEAAHATVALALRVPLREIRVKRVLNAGGWALPRIFGPIAVRAFGRTPPAKLAAQMEARRVDKMISFALAGACGDQIRVGACQGHDVDIAQAVDLALHQYDGREDVDAQRRAFRRLFRARLRAGELLILHEPAWGRIATALRTCDLLTGEDASALFARRQPSALTIPAKKRSK